MEIFLKDSQFDDDALEVMDKHFPHITVIGPEAPQDTRTLLRRKQAIVWCLKNVGPGSQIVRREDSLTMLRIDTDHQWMRIRTVFGFKDANQAFAFRMRWG